MDADTGRALLTGELSPTVALARGDVRTKGPVAKVLRLVPATVGAHEVEPTEQVEVSALAPGPAGGEAAAEEAAPQAEAPEAEAPPPAAEAPAPEDPPETEAP